MTLHEKIISLVPEIVELKWGCRILVHGVESVIVGKHLKEDYYYVQVGRNTSVERIPGIQATMRVRGRPITLADVLRAINSQFISVNSKGGDFMFERMNSGIGEFAQKEWFYTDKDGVRCVWNLATDLDGQSAETKAFISKILNV